MDKATWIEHLRGAIASARAAAPPRADTALTSIERTQRDIHGSCFAGFQRQLASALRERTVLLEGGSGYTPDPICVATGDAAFIDAFPKLFPADDRVVMGRAQKFFPLVEHEYTAFLGRVPEPKEFDFHVHWWSIFDAPAHLDAGWGQRFGLAIDPSVPHITHRIGYLWGPQHGFEDASLWRLDGDAMSLIKQDYARKRY